MKIKKFFIIVLFLFLFTVFIVGCNLTSSKKDLGLNTVDSAERLKSLLKDNKSINFDFGLGGMKAEAPGDAEYDSASPIESNGSTPDYTKTNVQVEGVDEGDIVKTDGKRIYSINHDRLQVVEVKENGQIELVLYEQMLNNVNNDYFYYNTYYRDLYITEDYLVVIANRYKYYRIIDGIITDEYVDKTYPGYGYYSTNTTAVIIYDITTLTSIDEYEVSGHYLSSRLIENNLYLITSYRPYRYIYNNEEEEFDLRPWSVHNNELKYFEYDEIKYLPDMNYQAYTIITTTKLNDEIAYENDIYLGSSSWGQIYVSKNNIYFATTTYYYDILGNANNNGLLVSYQFTVDGTVSYGGAGTYEGRIINQFAMDEYNGFMRIVTTDGWGTTVKNRLYVYERKLKDDKYVLEVVGKIEEGIGKPNERVQSVRFNKDIATVVTFQQTDPFYTIDLSDPKNPIIKGALEVPGFSTYQHPWTDTLVLGIGFDAVNGRTTGMKLSLYDISDIENPAEVGSPFIISDSTSPNTWGWSYSEALYNHKAIMIDKSHNSFGFSLYRYNYNIDSYRQVNDYIVFDVDASREMPIQIKHTVSHIDYYNDNENLYQNYWYYNFLIDRAVRIDDYLYVISGEAVTSHNLIGEFSLVDDVVFQRDKN